MKGQRSSKKKGGTNHAAGSHGLAGLAQAARTRKGARVVPRGGHQHCEGRSRKTSRTHGLENGANEKTQRPPNPVRFETMPRGMVVSRRELDSEQVDMARAEPVYNRLYRLLNELAGAVRKADEGNAT